MPESNGHSEPRRGLMARAFARWESMVDASIAWYSRLLNSVLRFRLLVVLVAVGLLAAVIVGLGSELRREFFPEVDSGAFEIYVRAPSGTRIELTNDRIAEVEAILKETINRVSTRKSVRTERAEVGESEPESDLQLFISEIGVTPDWSAAYTPNAGPMDAVIKVQLSPEREHSAQEYVHLLRERFRNEKKFSDLEFAFDAGGLIRGAMNEGKSTPINIRISAKNQEKAHKVATAIKSQVTRINGVVDARVIQRMNYPQYVINVNRAKAADLGLTQQEVMQNVVAALNSSIQFNKKNFWIDPISHNQYFVGVSYRPEEIESIDTLLNVPITGPSQLTPVPLRNLATITKTNVPTEVVHYNIQPTIELTMGVEGRDLGHVADDVAKVVAGFGELTEDGSAYYPYDPDLVGQKKPMGGAKMVLSGEYERMRQTFRDLGIGLCLATLLIYFLMVSLFKSYVTPLVILFAVPLGLIGVVTMLFLTGTAINVQSLAGRHLHGRHRRLQHRAAGRFRPEPPDREGAQSRSGDPRGGRHPGAAGGDDGPGGVLRPGADGVGVGAWQRGQRAAGSGGHRWAFGRSGDDLAGGALPVLVGRSREARRGRASRVAARD